MPKIQYIEHKFQAKSLVLLERANSIITDYRKRGYDLTLRQLYYQLVARDLIPNTAKQYKKLGNLISNARDAGLVDWYAIIDRTRKRTQLPQWPNPKDFLKTTAEQFRIDKWEGQNHRVFVWVEKEALAGVVSRACLKNNVQVGYVSCRGYMSSSTIWREARNLRRVSRNLGQHPVIIHLADHDPSGIDMSRDNVERLALYSQLLQEKQFTFRRIALNYDQIEQYDPPPNPTKMTDSRAAGYVQDFGYESWELDALDPDVLVSMIETTVDEYRDMGLWKKMSRKEHLFKSALLENAAEWEDEDHDLDEEE